MTHFTQEQTQIIESFGKGQAVVAGAGCGKTTTLVAKCLQLLQQNPQARFCAVSFTEKSVRDLKESLSQGFLKAGLYDLGSPMRNTHWVKTIHGLCSTIIQEFPTQAGLQGGERILIEDESSRLWEKSLNLLWSSNENEEISAAVEALLKLYSKSVLESLFQKLRSLKSFGVDEWIRKSFHREEVAALWLCFESIYHRYEHYKTRDGALDFNDLEIRAVRALEDPAVCKYYHARFDLVLVDEFQDTNPLQGKILERFVKPGLTNMCIVGDPKQSIYRFRDADVSVFQDLTEKLPLKHLLDTNYRSRPPIIDFVNEACAPIFEASELSYEALRAGKPAVVIEGEPAAKPLVQRFVFEEERELAHYLKAKSRGHVGEPPIDLSEYVILVRSLRKEKTQKFLKAMTEAQVPFLLGSGGRFYADPRVMELVAFLKGWISPKNTLSQVAALRSPWINVDDVMLMTWKDAYFDRFFQTSSHPIARALKEDFTRTHGEVVRPGQILEKIWMSEHFDEELYLPLVTLWHKAESLSAQGLRFEAVVQYFTKAIENDKIEKEIPPPAQAGAVRVLTIHGSKGLQFPRVLLLDFDGEYRGGGGGKDLIWDRKRGVHLFNRDERGKKEADDSENLAWEDLEKRNAVAESKRLFYVAITRAQEELILVWKKEVKIPAAAKAADFNPLLRDNWRMWVEKTALPPEIQFEPGSEVNSETPVLAEVFAESSVEEALAADTDIQPDLFSMIQPPKKVLPPAPHALDSAVQNELQKMAIPPVTSYRPRHSPSEWMILNQCGLRYQKRYLENLEPEEKTKSELKYDAERETHEDPAKKGERVHEHIELERWDEFIGEFADASTGQAVAGELRDLLSAHPTTTESFKELGFETPLNAQQALVGMMDRLEIDAENRSIRVVDYKWTQKSKSREELIAHYELQLQLYLWATSKLVSFIPEKISACLVHLTDTGLTVVEAPLSNTNLEMIEKRVKTLHAEAEKILHEKTAVAKPGTYCRYCEYQSICPAFKN